MSKKLREMNAKARDAFNRTVLLAIRVRSGEFFQADAPRDVLEQVVPTDNRFTADMSVVDLGISPLDIVTKRLRDSVNESLNQLAERLLNDGWKPHSVGPGVTYYFCKLVDGDVQYKEITTVIEREGNVLTATVLSKNTAAPVLLGMSSAELPENVAGNGINGE